MIFVTQKHKHENHLIILKKLVSTSKKTHRVPITKINGLMLFTEMALIAVCFENLRNL
jgi:hypothetical protein